MKNMKLLSTAFLTMLSSAALHAQAVTPTATHLGYAEEAQAIKLASREAELKPSYAWAREVVAIHFNPSSSDMAKKEYTMDSLVKIDPGATRMKGGAFGTSYSVSGYNHDGKAFDGFARPTPSESYYNNVVDYTQSSRNIAQYNKNVRSGKWHRFVNGE
jgi:hypothetical protein